MEELAPVDERDEAEDSLKVLESFNIMMVGESGLGKSTAQRNIFSHLDPTKLQEMKRRIAAQKEAVSALRESMERNRQEAKRCDDTRSMQLREEFEQLKIQVIEAEALLEEQRREKHRQALAVDALRQQIAELMERQKELREERDAVGTSFDEAQRLGTEVLELQVELRTKQEALADELRKGQLDRPTDGVIAQTTDVVPRLIEGMPLYAGAKEGLDVTLIDTPGYGDLNIDRPGNLSVDKVVAEVNRRIVEHLDKRVATRACMPLDDEKKLWNDLVHLCLFFVSPHRMKRADVELMRRLHTLVPLVVVVAKADTMTKAETERFKQEIRSQLSQQGVRTFAFENARIKEVEELHRMHYVAPSTSCARCQQPLQCEHCLESSRSAAPVEVTYHGNLPWAVMAADDSTRHYVWGTAETDNPHHSELPALRDLLLRAGGWRQLKHEAALKADVEGKRRKEAAGAARAAAMKMAAEKAAAKAEVAAQAKAAAEAKAAARMLPVLRVKFVDVARLCVALSLAGLAWMVARAGD